MNNIHSESYTIRANEIDTNGVARLDSIARLLQEIFRLLQLIRRI